MKTFQNTAAQGDVMFRRVESIPLDATAQPRDKAGTVTVAHSETGHHHSFDASCPLQLYTTPDPFVCFLRVEQPSLLEHHRQHDQHEALLFAPGCYEIRRQRERAYTPKGWAERMVQD